MNNARNIFNEPGAWWPFVQLPLTDAPTRENQVPAWMFDPPQHRSDHRFAKISLHTSRGHGKIPLQMASSFCFGPRSHKHKCL